MSERDVGERQRLDDILAELPPNLCIEARRIAANLLRTKPGGEVEPEREGLAAFLEQRCFFESNGVGCEPEQGGPCNYCLAAALLREG